MPLNCGVGEDSWESLGLQGDLTNPSWRRSVLGVHWKDWCWSWNSNTLATWCEELTHWKRPWSWERVRAGEGDDRGWDGWMASLTWWTWVWVDYKSWWWTGMDWHAAVHGVTESRIGLSDWTELNDLTLFLKHVPEKLSILKTFRWIIAILILKDLYGKNFCKVSDHLLIYQFCKSKFSILCWLKFLKL